ncbi:related to component of NuA3 histone acetyltransferase complex [Rhynchosporium graminicola]|uniref:uS12 prolyl 3,4-dihydroxylase n=1 Tax=Rhynchosporium graminicola TaxID=2792576 RepID=A0A1E1JXV4_9HELO|nr:related to component of NuA3 histone acetyltransferase complex [Rhynchosporium commune]
MKRKADTQLNDQNGKGILKKRAKTVLAEEDVHKSFRKGLFAKDVLGEYTKGYAESEPYKHSVINSLINDELLRSVRDEIKENVQFAPKETDIYKIHQSGDLANLDGLDDGALEKLPSLLRLRDAMYSSKFRKYVSTITGSGELSGRKTDMAINVYTPGCHLLCHDDVIGSRRISYILYLTDPDIPWKEEWGGALRLFPTTTHEDDGVKTITPTPDTTKSIPPAWNQLSFFAVQPGLSFHDVEEVYHAENEEQLKKDGGRIRMAISGWFHIPQIGEEGYIEGEEEKWGKNSSLKQLQGNPDRYDSPKPQPIIVEVPAEPTTEKELTEFDLDFLLKYMAPTYLTPDTLEDMAESFMDASTVTLDGLLSNKFSARVREYIEAQEASPLPTSSAEIEKGSWKVAKPPHKHRFLYMQPFNSSDVDKASLDDPIKELTEIFLPSRHFRLWLEIATKCNVQNYDILARRFRRGLDYALATSHDGEPRLEVSLGLTPTPGWGVDEEEMDSQDTEDGEDEENSEGNEKGDGPEAKIQANGSKPKQNGEAKANGKITDQTPKEDVEEEGDEGDDEGDDVGGHEVYMAADDDEDENEDAAVYKTSDESQDDNVLFTMPASWNKMSIVLRDSGVLKFVKYVSKNAKGDRWDVNASFGVKIEDIEGEEEMVPLEESDEEETFKGFPDSDDSDSD